jgi:hypothetical protein
MMPKLKPGESLDEPKRARSFGISIGATEFIFLAGLAMLAAGVWLAFGFFAALMAGGGVLVVTSWLMQFAE